MVAPINKLNNSTYLFVKIRETSEIFRPVKRAIFCLAFLLTISIILAGCSGDELDLPIYQPIADPPIEVTLEQLFNDYLADRNAADVKYNEQRLLFKDVKVEKTGGEWVYIGLGEWVFEKTFFTSESVKFRLRGEDYGIMQNIEVGYILNVVGESRGLISSAYGNKEQILVDDCWVESVVGDLGTNVYEDPY